MYRSAEAGDQERLLMTEWEEKWKAGAASRGSGGGGRSGGFDTEAPMPDGNDFADDFGDDDIPF